MRESDKRRVLNPGQFVVFDQEAVFESWSEGMTPMRVVLG
jgi:hypothetical protein